MPKPAKKDAPEPTQRSFWMKTPVLATLIILLLASPFIANYFYSNWSNSRLINGISEDFPRLIAEIEQAINLDLNITSDCMQTTEKFSGGVNLCGITVGKSAEESPKELLALLINAAETNSDFKKGESYRDGAGYRYAYMKKHRCTVNYIESIFIDCLIAPRKANEQLALDKLNADHLNARKAFYRSQLQ